MGDLSIAPVFISIGILLTSLMVLWLYKREGGGKDTLFSPKIFKFKDFDFSLATIFIVLIPMSGMMFTLPVFWQSVRHYDAFETGLTFLPYSITLFLIAPSMGKLASKVSPKYIIQSGIVLSMVGLWLMHDSFTVDSTWKSAALSIGVYGAGIAMVFSQIQNYLLSTVDKKYVW
ncbi:MAG: MFS transporter [Candidatus Dojkabacteria bacterium]|nr:MFS transporter [Candidatus Dojkabacteria bacterium]